jgi:hypothetical protein
MLKLNHRTMALYLSITALPSLHTPGTVWETRVPFMRVQPNVPWIYAYSDDRSTLEEFKARIERWTPAQYLQHMKVDIRWTDTMSETVRQINRDSSHCERPVEPNWFYLDGCVNNDHERRRLDDFTLDAWRWWPEEAEADSNPSNVASLESEIGSQVGL